MVQTNILQYIFILIIQWLMTETTLPIWTTAEQFIYIGILRLRISISLNLQWGYAYQQYIRSFFIPPATHVHSFYCCLNKNSSYRLSWMTSRDNWRRLHVIHRLTGTEISSVSLKRFTGGNWARLDKMKQKEDRRK